MRPSLNFSTIVLEPWQALCLPSHSQTRPSHHPSVGAHLLTVRSSFTNPTLSDITIECKHEEGSVDDGTLRVFYLHKFALVSQSYFARLILGPYKVGAHSSIRSRACPSEHPLQDAPHIALLTIAPAYNRKLASAQSRFAATPLATLSRSLHMCTAGRTMRSNTFSFGSAYRERLLCGRAAALPASRLPLSLLQVRARPL